MVKDLIWNQGNEEERKPQVDQYCAKCEGARRKYEGGKMIYYKCKKGCQHVWTEYIKTSVDY